MSTEAAAVDLAGCKGSEEATAVRTLAVAENLKSTNAPEVNARSLRPSPGGPAGAGRLVGTASGLSHEEGRKRQWRGTSPRAGAPALG